MTTESKKPDVLDPKANIKALSRIVVLVAVLLGGVWLYLRFTRGQEAATAVAAKVLKTPIELKNSIESLPASSVKGFELNLPYTGSLTIDSSVVKGNELDIFLITPDQIDNVKAKKDFKHFPEFKATKTKSYRRSGRLASGTYYLVFADKTLGILSASSSDIKIQARLAP